MGAGAGAGVAPTVEEHVALLESRESDLVAADRLQGCSLVGIPHIQRIVRVMMNDTRRHDYRDRLMVALHTWTTKHIAEGDPTTLTNLIILVSRLAAFCKARQVNGRNESVLLLKMLTEAPTIATPALNNDLFRPSLLALLEASAIDGDINSKEGEEFPGRLAFLILLFNLVVKTKKHEFAHASLFHFFTEENSEKYPRTQKTILKTILDKTATVGAMQVPSSKLSKAVKKTKLAAVRPSMEIPLVPAPTGAPTGAGGGSERVVTTKQEKPRGTKRPRSPEA